MVVRWELLSHQDGKLWSWRRIGPGDAIERTSEALPTFGKAIADAITHGFRPKEDRWVINHGTWSTHYGPGGAPIAIEASPGPAAARRWFNECPDRRNDKGESA